MGVLTAVAGQVIVPPAVLSELSEGRSRGVDLPRLEGLAWVTVRTPVGAPAASLIADLGPGETQVLRLALEMPGAVVVLDDACARRVAELRHVPLTGTLGLPIDAKRAGFLAAIKPSLDQLQILGFRLAAQTRAAVLKLAGEREEE